MPSQTNLAQLPVGQIGFGAMRITGPGVWGPPRDEGEAIARRSEMLRLAADQRKIILGHAEETGRFIARRLLPVKAVTDGDEGGIGIKLEFDCVACALSRVLLCHVLDASLTGKRPWRLSV